MRNTAEEYFLQGYNCAQSVVLAFSHLIKEKSVIDESQLVRMVSPFGGGMGRLREVCGAVSGMLFVLGALEGYDNPKDNTGKTRLYEDIQLLAERFEKENGSIICRNLLGLKEGRENPVPEERSEEYYRRRPCAEMVRSAAEILDDFLHERNYLHNE